MFHDPRGLHIPGSRRFWKTQLALGALSIVYFGWTIGKIQRERFSLKRRGAFLRSATDNTLPFYGRSFGCLQDFHIEKSLKTGDLIFLKTEIRALPVTEALRRKLSTTLTAREWDEVGVIRRTDVTGPVSVYFEDRHISYTDLLSDVKTARVGLRKLCCPDESRNSIYLLLTASQNTVGELPSVNLIRSSDSERFNAAVESFERFSLINSMLESDYEDIFLSAQTDLKKIRKSRNFAADILAYAGLINLHAFDFGKIENICINFPCYLSPIFLIRDGDEEYANYKSNMYTGLTSYQRLRYTQR
jgi:hypothetical protein